MKYSIGLNWFSTSLPRLAVILLAGCLTATGHSETTSQANLYQWRSIGPYGGDARAFAAVPGEPGHLYLGDTNSWVFESLDGGANWKRVGKVDVSDDLIVDSLVVDESDRATIFAGVHRVGRPDGGLYTSHDGGKTWKPSAALAGQSILSLAQAPSNPDVLAAGSLKGVYRSRDHGRDLGTDFASCETIH